MITLIEAEYYRCLRRVQQQLDRFHVLIGPNGAGKSTFLQIPRLLKDFVSRGPRDSISELAPDCRELFWNRGGDRFAFAVEARIPANVQRMLTNGNYTKVRYEVEIGIHPMTQEVAVLGEHLYLASGQQAPERSQYVQQLLFPQPMLPDGGVVRGGREKENCRDVISRSKPSGTTYFTSETTKWKPPFQFGPDKSALGNLPADESRWPVGTWFKACITEETHAIFLNSERLRAPSPPGTPSAFLPDGRNLPWVVHALRRDDPDSFGNWIAHVRTALPDLRSIETIERPEDRHRYLVLEYEGGLKIPSWVVSDGTLRMLALTLLAYIRGLKGIYLIEEPENGLHPLAVQSVFQALSSVYDAQILMATHSPVVLGLAKPEDILCFGKTEDGATDIVRGSEHPKLRNWHGEPSFDVLFASGVLG